MPALFSRFLVAAPSSGSGKTTVSLGLSRAFRNRGRKVQPFKCGPDYIDTKYHDIAAGRPSINLDLFLGSAGHLRALYQRYSLARDVALIEGVMGLFDGFDRLRGSSAEVAMILDLPVILVLRASSLAYSAAPLLYGFKNFRPELKIAGVIFNFVSGPGHYRHLSEACAEAGLTPLGWLPRNAAIEIPSRYLGLHLDQAVTEFADQAASLIGDHLDLDRLLELTSSGRPADPAPPAPPAGRNPPVIAVAHDEAFNFLYQENLASLARIGHVTYFSPLADVELPAADLVYLPGGYPELHQARLSGNRSFLQSLREYAEGGGRIWAEGGGLMYLGQAIIDAEGRRWPMAGLFSHQATMENRKLRLGYRTLSYNGHAFKGHEFRYSSLTDAGPGVGRQYNAQGQELAAPFWRHKNVLASYTHLYWAEQDDFLSLFQ